MANTTSELYKKCEGIINEIVKHPSVGYFLNLSSYTMKNPSIKESIDLAILEQKLKQGEYLHIDQFVADARKIWDNSWKINATGSDLFIATTEISNIFENLLKDLFRQNTDKGAKMPKSKPKADSKQKLDAAKNVRPMTIQEKNALRNNILKLAPEMTQGLIEILKPVVDTSKSNGSLEFDLDKLPRHICRELENYVNSFINKKPVAKGPAASEPKPAVNLV